MSKIKYLWKLSQKIAITLVISTTSSLVYTTNNSTIDEIVAGINSANMNNKKDGVMYLDKAVPFYQASAVILIHIYDSTKRTENLLKESLQMVTNEFILTFRYCKNSY